MTTSGRVVFSQMDEVVFGAPAAQAVADLARRAGAERVLLMVSGTLNRETPEIERVRAALGNRCAAVFDRVPAHTPAQGGGRGRGDGPRRRRRPDRDGRRRLGHRRGQGGAALPGERRPLGGGAGRAAPGEGAGRHDGPAALRGADGAPDRRADDPVRRRVQRHRRRHGRADQGEGAVPPPAHRPGRGRPRPRDHRAHPGVAVPVHRHPRGRPLRRRHLLAGGASLRRRAGAPGPRRCLRTACRA